MFFWRVFPIVLVALVGRGVADSSAVSTTANIPTRIDVKLTTSATISTTAPVSNASSSASPPTNAGPSNVFSIVVSVPADLKNASALITTLAGAGISTSQATLPSNKTGSIQIKAPVDPGWIVVNITDVTSDFQEPLQQINISQANANNLTDLRSTNDSRATFLFLDTCTMLKNAKFINDNMGNNTWITLFDVMTNASIFRGVFINLTNEVNVSHAFSFSQALRNNMSLGHSYLITFNETLNISTFMNMSTRLCRGYIGRQNISGPSVVTVSPCNSTDNSTTCQTTAASTTGVTTVSTSTLNVTTSNATATTPAPTQPPTTTRVTNGTVATFTVKQQISSGHAKTSVALGIILTLLIVAIACFVFRRRISTYVRAKMSRTRPIISTLGFAPYGTLRNEYMDLEDFGARRQSGPS